MLIISTSGIHYSLVSIDIGNLWEVISDALTKKAVNWIGVKDYTVALSNAIAKENNDGVLYVSVGTGDFLTPWIRRLCSETITDRNTVKIQKIVIKHINFDLARGLERLGTLESKFVDKLQLNIESLKSDPALKCYNIEIEVQQWTTMPFFHGYLIGDEFLIGAWQVGHGGQLHVRTPIFKSDMKKLPNVYTFVKSKFEEK